MFETLLLIFVVVALIYHERRIRPLERRVQEMDRKPTPPVPQDGDSRNVAERAVELHERRHHLRGK